MVCPRPCDDALSSKLSMWFSFRIPFLWWTVSPLYNGLFKCSVITKMCSATCPLLEFGWSGIRRITYPFFVVCFPPFQLWFFSPQRARIMRAFEASRIQPQLCERPKEAPCRRTNRSVPHSQRHFQNGPVSWDKTVHFPNSFPAKSDNTTDINTSQEVFISRILYESNAIARKFIILGTSTVLLDAGTIFTAKALNLSVVSVSASSDRPLGVLNWNSL